MANTSAEIETDYHLQTRRSAIVLEEPEPADYLVLGDFGGSAITENPPLIDRDNFDPVLAKFGLSLAGAAFRELEDFHPDRLYQRLDWFREFRAESQPPAAREHSTPKADLSELLQSSSLLDQIAGGGDPFDRYVKELASAHAAQPNKPIDEAQQNRLAETMRAVLHHPRFQTLEANWRGLNFAVRSLEGEAEHLTRIRVAHLLKTAALADLNEAASLRETRLFQLLKQRRYRAVFGLYSFGADSQDSEFLGRMALLSSNTNSVFIAEGSMDMGANWDELRAIPEAAHVGLALPRFLLRLPYGRDTRPIDSFPFEEMPAEPVHAHYLWGPASLACLPLLVNEPIKDELELDDLPLHTYKADSAWKMTPAAELWMTEAEVSALVELGLMPLVSDQDTGRVRLSGFRAINGKALRLRA